MKFLPPDHLTDLINAVYASVTGVDDVVLLVNGPPLLKDFNALTARGIPLRTNVEHICLCAFNEGWALQLFEAALSAKPDNPQLRAFAAVVSTLPDGVPSAAARSGRPSLECGRDTQWASVQRHARSAQHHVILVMGELGQASLHFRERIQTYLHDPRCSPLVVQWQSRPHSQAEYFAPLAEALRCTPATLEATLASRLAVQNLVLLHDRIRQGFDDKTLVQYYTAWLPGLVAGRTYASRLKIVQPIEWPEDTSSGLLDRLFGGEDEGKGHGAALSLRDRLVEQQKSWMPVVFLKDLSDLTDEELTGFLDDSLPVPAQRAAMLAAVRECRPVPEEQFESIDNHWNEVLSLS